MGWRETDPLGTSTFDVWVSPPDCSTADGPAQTVSGDPLRMDYGTDVTLDGGDGPYCITIVAHDVLVADPPGAQVAATLDTTPPSPPGAPDATNPADSFPSSSGGPAPGDHGGSGVATYTVYQAGVAIHSEAVGDGSRGRSSTPRRGRRDDPLRHHGDRRARSRVGTGDARRPLRRPSTQIV